MSRLNYKLEDFIRHHAFTGDVCLLEISGNELQLAFLRKKEPDFSDILTALTWNELLSKLPHEPATPQDLERAIAFIEDRLLEIIPSFPHRNKLVTFEPVYLSILDSFGGDDRNEDPVRLIEADIEIMYRKLADIAYGTPISRYDIPVDQAFTAANLFLRELMHHAGFDHISLYTKGNQ